MMLQKIHFFGSVGVLYLMTIGTLGITLYASHLFGTPVWATQPATSLQHTPLPPAAISGKPTQLIIPDSGIDIPVVDGAFDATSNGWTLSDTNAQYWTASAKANDRAGMTFIYGHGTDAVFGKIGSSHPPVGTIATLRTDNGRTFTYKLELVKNFTPTDVSLLEDTTSGKPRLIVQTCTGAFNEWRTMFVFQFEGVSA